MWKEYSVSYIKSNRSSSISIVAASLISALFLSFLCTLFYNLWIYEIEQIKAKEGDWQGRIIGEIREEDLQTIQNFANVESVIINNALSGERGVVVDLTFVNARAIFQDIPWMIETLGLEGLSVEYHTLLLSRYLIHDPHDEEPPLLITFYLSVLIIVSFSLLLIIRNSFAVSMNARLHQFGIFSSVGATPRQIRICLIQEAAILCTVPVLIGNLLGVIISMGTIEVMERIGEDIVGRQEAVFQYHPLIFIAAMIFTVITVFLSAWIPARKLSKLTPLEAIRIMGGLQLKRKKSSRILSMIFGIEGELAGNALKAQKKALRTSTISLILSFLGFTMMLCFFTLSGISTRETYFEKYQFDWDIMVTLKDTGIGEFGLTEEVRELPGVQNSIVYQKGMGTGYLPENRQSEELIALGGLEAVAGSSVSKEDKYLQVKIPIMIMDDASFLEYCTSIGILPRLDGAVVLNRIWDSINSHFRNSEYIPFVKENGEATVLRSTGQENEGEISAGIGGQEGGTVDIPVLAYTQDVPRLREEYANYALVHFIPLSMWNEISEQMEYIEKDTYIRILARSGNTMYELDRLDELDKTDELNKLRELEKDIAQLVGTEYDILSENRIQEKISNDEMINGFQLIIGAFCFLLALIGVANIFSNTLGFIYQRKREFAQLLSVGVTPAGIRKMFCIEAMVIAGRPFLITLPLTALFVIFAVTASHLNLMTFLVEAPVVPIILFSITIFAFIALAYYIGGKKVLKNSLVDALRDDTMV